MNHRALLLALALPACSLRVTDLQGSDGGAALESRPGDLRCEPGERVYCRCDDGAAGGATCLARDTRGPCACDPPALSRADELAARSPPQIRDEPACPRSTGACYVEPAAGPLCPCPRVRGDPARPAWRITAMDIVAPSSLSAGPMGEVLTRSILAGQLLLGLDADLGAQRVRFGRLDRRATRRGVVGIGMLDAGFRFFDANADAPDPRRFDPTSAAIAVARGQFSTPLPLGRFELPIQFLDRTEVVDVPLCDLRLRRVPLSDDAGCVGAAVPTDGLFDECRPRWDATDGGELTAAITLSQSAAIRVDATGRTLCSVLAGADCADAARGWPVRPDAYACGEAAWTITARFTAVAATIAR